MNAFEAIQKSEALRRSLVNEYPELKGWRFTLDNAKRRMGLCLYKKRVISLSRYLVNLNSWERVEQTVRHELAHAIVGAGHGHDRVWRNQARRLGHSGARCSSAADTVMVQAPWIGVCPNGHETERFKAPTKRALGMSCGRCSSVYNPAFKFTWRRRTVSR